MRALIALVALKAWASFSSFSLTSQPIPVSPPTSSLGTWGGKPCPLLRSVMEASGPAGVSCPQVQDVVKCQMGVCRADESEDSPDSCKNGQLQILVSEEARADPLP